MALKTQTFTYGSLTEASVSAGYLLELQLTQLQTDPVTNTSQVAYRLCLRSGDAHRFSLYRIGAVVELDGMPVFFRSRLDSESYTLGFQSSITLAQGETTIHHESDGTKTIAAAFSIDMEKAYYTPGSIRVVDAFMTLTPIAGESTLAATAASIGQVSVLTVQRKHPDYTHTIRWQMGKLWGYIGGDWENSQLPVQLADTVISFRLPEHFYSQLPDSTTGICTLEITTFCGEEPVGQPQQTALTVTTDAAVCAPEAALTVTDGNPVTLALTGDPKTLIRFCSTAVCQVSATAKNGASIGEITVAGIPLAGESLQIEQVESSDISCLVRDSRGYTAAVYAPDLTLIPYKKLTNNAGCHRPDPTANQGVLTLQGQVFAGNFGVVNNNIVVTYQVADRPEQVAQVTVSDDGYYGQILLEELDYRTAYPITVTVSDALMTVTKTLLLGKGEPVFDWGESDFQFHVPVQCPSLNGVYMRQVPGRVFLPLDMQAFVFSGSGYGLLDRGVWYGSDQILATGHVDRIELHADTSMGILSLTPIEIMEEIQ